jgi:hypothetical protein
MPDDIVHRMPLVHVDGLMHFFQVALTMGIQNFQNPQQKIGHF